MRLNRTIRSIYIFSTKSSLKCFRDGKLDILSLYWYRYLRLTPLMAVCALVLGTIYRFFGNGPIWPLRDQERGLHCQEYWWSTLLYIQNYVNPGKNSINNNNNSISRIHINIFLPISFFRVKFILQVKWYVCLLLTFQFKYV